MYKIEFPERYLQRYWEIHFKYLLNIFKYMKCDISFYHREDDSLIVKIEGKEFDFNYWDSSDKYTDTDLFSFKFHCKELSDKVTAFTPVSFYNWEQYYQAEKEIEYNPIGKNKISSRQRPYAGALERRLQVQGLLKEKYKQNTLISLVSQEEYWSEIENIKVAVFVPGQNNNILDRGQLQYMAFGVCTVSPNLPELLPSLDNIYEGYHCKRIVPNQHYIQCKDDYSDLIDIIDNLSDGKCNKIGENAKILFKETSTPEVLLKWIGKHL